MKLDTIVVGVDFSSAGDLAVAQAEAIAEARNAELVLVHASGIDQAGMYVYEVAGRVDEPWKAYVHGRLEHGREQLEALATELKARGRRARPVHVQGFADAGIAEAAREVDADLVVVGTHGRTGVQRWLLGSVAERVTRLSERHVLVARAPVVRSFDHILVGSDFSPASELALDAALTVASPGAKIEVVHCCHQPFTVSEEAPPWLNERLQQRAHEQGNRLLADKGPQRQGLEVHLDVVQGAPAPTLQTRMAEGDYDALFLGSHGKRGMRRMLLGSVTEQSIRYAHGPVFVAYAGE